MWKKSGVKKKENRKCSFCLLEVSDRVYNTEYPVYIVKSNMKSIQGTLFMVFSQQLYISKYAAG